MSRLELAVRVVAGLLAGANGHGLDRALLVVAALFGVAAPLIVEWRRRRRLGRELNAR